MIRFLAPRVGEVNMKEYLEYWGKGVADRVSVLNYDDLPRCTSLPRGVYILSSLDQLLPAGQRYLAEVVEQLTRQGVSVFNAPGVALLRYPLLKELHRVGLNRHKAVRAAEDPTSLVYPVFLREANRHTGPASPLIYTPAELEIELGLALVRGHRLDELLIMEYFDTASSDGYYRKYAAFVVGTEIIPRGLALGRTWALKFAQSEFTPAMAAEEREYMLQNPHDAALRDIFRVGGVRYGRIDYSLKDGKIETWEINLNPTIGRGLRPPSGVVPPEIQALREEARSHFYRRFQAALEAIDEPGDGGGGAIPITFSQEARETPGPIAQTPLTPAAPYQPLRWLLRPVKRLLNPIARWISPFLLRKARRRPPSEQR
jgi:hypothetical protein